MFGHSYFGARYFGPWYWGVGGAAPPPVPPVVLPAGPGRFRLTVPHVLQIQTIRGRVPALHLAGTIVEKASMPSNWVPTPFMTPLDTTAYEMLEDVCDALRAANPEGDIPGFGPRQNLPA